MRHQSARRGLDFTLPFGPGACRGGARRTYQPRGADGPQRPLVGTPVCGPPFVIPGVLDVERSLGIGIIRQLSGIVDGRAVEGVELGVVLCLPLILACVVLCSFCASLLPLRRCGDKAGKRPVIQGLEAAERESRLVAETKKDDGLITSTAQFVVQKTLVEDAKVLGREVREADRSGELPHGPSLPNACRRPAEQVEDLVDDGIAGTAVERLDGRYGTADRFGRPSVSRREQLATVAGNGQSLVCRSLLDQLEEGEEPWPCPRPMTQPLMPHPAAGAVELFTQPGQAVRLVIDAVVDRKELTGLSKEEHHQAHHHARRGDVDIASSNVALDPVERRGTRRDHRFNRPPYLLAEEARQLRLSASGRLDGGEKRWGAVGSRHERPAVEKGTKRCHLGPWFALQEPERRVPLCPGVGLGPCPDQAPLAAVGHQSDRPVRPPKPLNDPGDAPPAPADPKPRRTVRRHEHWEGDVAAGPDAARADRLSG